MLQFTAYLLQAQKYVCSPLFLSKVGLGPWWVGYAYEYFMATGKRLPLNFD